MMSEEGDLESEHNVEHDPETPDICAIRVRVVMNDLRRAIGQGSIGLVAFLVWHHYQS